MSSAIYNYINTKLLQRKHDHNFRSLKITSGLIDFYSNDYLGFARSETLKNLIAEELKQPDISVNGSTGSRLLSGNSQYAEELEKFIAAFHGTEDAVLFNSGFDANYGLISCLPYRGDTVIYDELIHASVHDGLRNTKANTSAFEHNNINDLEEKLKSATGLKYVVTESVFSMDGDFAPLPEIAALCKKYDAGLIVDEAHATGVFGEQGTGCAAKELETVARVVTYGKAMGAHGAAILCTTALKQFLINYCRPFIYSTALPAHSMAAIQCAYRYLEHTGQQREQLAENIAHFKSKVKQSDAFTLITSNSPIQSIIVSGNEQVKDFARQIQEKGLDVRPILRPTVPPGKERIRICLHSFNTLQEVTYLAETINTL